MKEEKIMLFVCKIILFVCLIGAFLGLQQKYQIEQALTLLKDPKRSDCIHCSGVDADLVCRLRDIFGE